MTTTGTLDGQFDRVVSDYESGESASSIARRFGVSTWSVITRLKKAGIQVRKPNDQNSVSLGQTKTDRFSYKELVDGVLLGDGQIDPKNTLHLEQTVARRGWILQVRRHLQQTGATAKIISIPSRVRVIEGRRIIAKKASHLYTPSYMENRELRQRWYGTGVKRVPEDLVLIPMMLAHWVAGDGTAHNCGGLTLCTNGFSRECVEFLVSRFWEDLGIAASVGSTSREGQYVLNIHRRDEAVKVKRLIGNRLPKCCRYKLRLIQPTVKNGGISAKEMRKRDR